MLKHFEKYNKKKIKFFIFISLLMGFSSALLSYILSFYFKTATKMDNIGIFFPFLFL